MTSESLVAENMSTRPGLRMNMITIHSLIEFQYLLRTGLSVRKQAR